MPEFDVRHPLTPLPYALSRIPHLNPEFTDLVQKASLLSSLSLPSKAGTTGRLGVHLAFTWLLRHRMLVLMLVQKGLYLLYSIPDSLPYFGVGQLTEIGAFGMPQDAALSSCSGLGWEMCSTMPSFDLGSWDLNLSLHGCVTSALSTELSPQPWLGAFLLNENKRGEVPVSPNQIAHSFLPSQVGITLINTLISCGNRYVCTYMLFLVSDHMINIRILPCIQIDAEKQLLILILFQMFLS